MNDTRILCLDGHDPHLQYMQDMFISYYSNGNTGSLEIQTGTGNTRTYTSHVNANMCQTEGRHAISSDHEYVPVYHICGHAGMNQVPGSGMYPKPISTGHHIQSSPPPPLQ